MKVASASLLLTLPTYWLLAESGEPTAASEADVEREQRLIQLKVAQVEAETKKLVEEKDALEREIAGLQLRRPSMDAAEYSAQLEKLLTDLALKTKAIRDRAAKAK